ncbi:MAG TPA: hypothetical protein DIT25_04415 [Candidatus Moranbacteria bacterium]|nr:hypothetical protein [Candidatus Moranbacteria bacterium]
MKKPKKPIRKQRGKNKVVFDPKKVNIELIESRTEKFILESGFFPSLAEDIRLRRMYERPRRRIRRIKDTFISE